MLFVYYILLHMRGSVFLLLKHKKAGCPVIAYNNSSIPEIIGDSSLLIDNLSVNDINEKNITIVR